jgi:probable non-F420 flavinoid oxidoreductase
MVSIGFHASHEQFPPSELLSLVCDAEAAGFHAILSSDHWAPWSSRQGQSGHAWTWLGAALQATSLPCGVITSPGQRYHVAVLAQAMATLSEMFSGRFWAALGSGEALNEHITGDRWPDKPTRDRRWETCAEIVRRLLDGDEVSYEGLVRVDRARLWTRPISPPPVLAAAVSEASARRAARWADGLVTLYRPPEALRPVIDGFREEAGAGKPVHVQVHLSWSPAEDEAEAAAHDQWRTNVFDNALMWNLETPDQFDAAAEHVRADDVRKAVLVSADLGRHRAWLEELVELGVDGVFLHEVGRRQRRFIERFGADVLPCLAGL